MTLDTQKVSEAIAACIKNCTYSHAVALETLTYCLSQEGGMHNHIRTLLDCASMCQTHVDFMMRGSDLYAATARACAEVCERCAAECSSMANDLPMSKCAEACRQSIESCRQLAAAGKA